MANSRLYPCCCASHRVVQLPLLESEPVLWEEAIDLLMSGRTLSVKGVKTPVRLVVLPPEAEPDRYQLEVYNQQPRQFQRVYQALRAFERLVGRNGLARAISEHRYAHLFPQGSSLSWDIVPLSGWVARARKSVEDAQERPRSSLRWPLSLWREREQEAS
jgi:hypothetical protein